MPSPTLLVVLVALAAVFASAAIVSSLKCAATSREMRETLAALRSARSRIEAHDSEIEAISDALRLLRGKFYAERRKSPPDGSNSDSQPEAIAAATPPADVAGRVAWKQQMRAKYGLVPTPTPRP